MADRQTAGGYPKIASVIAADLPIAGQLAPGDTIEFAWCSRQEAGAALIARERRCCALPISSPHDDRERRPFVGALHARRRRGSAAASVAFATPPSCVRRCAGRAQSAMPVHILGGGSNVVFADEGFDGLVIHVDIGGDHAARRPRIEVRFESAPASRGIRLSRPPLPAGAPGSSACPAFRARPAARRCRTSAHTGRMCRRVITGVEAVNRDTLGVEHLDERGVRVRLSHQPLQAARSEPLHRDARALRVAARRRRHGALSGCGRLLRADRRAHTDARRRARRHSRDPPPQGHGDRSRQPGESQRRIVFRQPGHSRSSTSCSSRRTSERCRTTAWTTRRVKVPAAWLIEQRRVREGHVARGGRAVAVSGAGDRESRRRTGRGHPRPGRATSSAPSGTRSGSRWCRSRCSSASRPRPSCNGCSTRRRAG